MKIAFLIIFALLTSLAHARCPSGMFSDTSKDPFYKFTVDENKNIYLIFCGYPGQDKGQTIETGEYAIFLTNATDIPINGSEPILYFDAVHDTVIYKSSTRLKIKDIWGGFTYTFNKNTKSFTKEFSYKPNTLTQKDFENLKANIESGKLDYMDPWQVLDAVILGYPGADKLFNKLPWYLRNSAAGAEEFDKAELVYKAYNKSLKSRNRAGRTTP